MKATVKLTILSSLVFSLSCVANGEKNKTEIETMLQKNDSYEYNLVGKRLLRPIDEALLKRLVAHPEETVEHDFALSAWLLRIAAEKDRKYLWLLENKELKKGGERWEEEIVDLLLAYDYNVNGNKKSLETLLARVQKAMNQGDGWGATYALAAVNEWDLCKRALGGFGGGDGANGDERYGFWLTRRYFFPENKEFPTDYEAFCRAQLQPQSIAEEAGTGQPATRPELKSEGSDKPQPESEGRSR